MVGGKELSYDKHQSYVENTLGRTRTKGKKKNGRGDERFGWQNSQN